MHYCLFSKMDVKTFKEIIYEIPEIPIRVNKKKIGFGLGLGFVKQKN